MKVKPSEVLIPVLSVLVVISLWFLSYFAITVHISGEDTSELWAKRGQLGDMFGAVNAMFSGLAFAGIIFTIYLQRQELRAQRQELQLTRNEFKTQNRTLKRQRFETTFFNMLSIHFQMLEKARPSIVPFSPDFRASIGSDRLKFKPEHLPLYKAVYNEYLRRTYPELSGYLQSLLSIHNVIRQQAFSANTEQHYLSIFGSYLSLDERVFLFYHATLSEFPDNAFHEMANDLDLFTMDSERLFDPSHFWLTDHLSAAS